MPPQALDLPGCQADARVLVGRPPAQASRREAFRAEPEALPLIKQACDSRPGAVAADKDRAGQGRFPQHLAAYRGKAVEALANVDGLRGEHETAWGGALEQQRVAKKVRPTASRGHGGSGACIRRRVPSGRWSALAMPEVGRGQTGAAGPSTKPRAAVAAGVDRAAWWAAPRFCNAPPRTRSRVATRGIGPLAVKALACSHR
jgi:hypothetical protein